MSKVAHLYKINNLHEKVVLYNYCQNSTFFLSQLLLFKTVPLFFMKKIKFTEKESKNMFDILCQIYDGLRDKNGRKKTNKLPLHEVMWYKAIDEFMNKKGPGVGRPKSEDRN